MDSIATILKPEHKAFAEGLLEGKSQADAYRAAYPHAKTVSYASALARHPDVVAYVQRRRDLMEARETLSALQRRNHVIRGLLRESEAKDNPPAVRVRALELVGRMHDVRLFTDGIDVVDASRTASELRRQLETRLSRVLGADDAEEIIEDSDT